MTPTTELPIVFAATTTLRDIAAAEAILRPSRKRKMAAWRRPAIIIGCVFVGLSAGVLSGSGDQTTFVETLFTTRLGLQFAAMLAVLFLALWVAGPVRRSLNRVLVRAAHVDARRAHPAVAVRDPDLPIERRYRFDDDGMTTSTAYDEIWESWRRITALDETTDLLVVRVGAIAAYPLPKAQLSPEVQARLTQLVLRNCSSKWPF